MSTPRRRLPEMTPELAHVIATDAANRSMRRGDRTAWNEDDYNEAARIKLRLLAWLWVPKVEKKGDSDG